MLSRLSTLHDDLFSENTHENEYSITEALWFLSEKDESIINKKLAELMKQLTQLAFEERHYKKFHAVLHKFVEGHIKASREKSSSKVNKIFCYLDNCLKLIALFQKYGLASTLKIEEMIDFFNAPEVFLNVFELYELIEKDFCKEYKHGDATRTLSIRQEPKAAIFYIFYNIKKDIPIPCTLPTPAEWAITSYKAAPSDPLKLLRVLQFIFNYTDSTVLFNNPVQRDNFIRILEDVVSICKDHENAEKVARLLCDHLKYAYHFHNIFCHLIKKFPNEEKMNIQRLERIKKINLELPVIDGYVIKNTSDGIISLMQENQDTDENIRTMLTYCDRESYIKLMKLSEENLNTAHEQSAVNDILRVYFEKNESSQSYKASGLEEDSVSRKIDRDRVTIVRLFSLLKKIKYGSTEYIKQAIINCINTDINILIAWNSLINHVFGLTGYYLLDKYSAHCILNMNPEQLLNFCNQLHNMLIEENYTKEELQGMSSEHRDLFVVKYSLTESFLTKAHITQCVEDNLTPSILADIRAKFEEAGRGKAVASIGFYSQKPQTSSSIKPRNFLVEEKSPLRNLQLRAHFDPKVFKIILEMAGVRSLSFPADQKPVRPSR